jgi:hypothetical protein
MSATPATAIIRSSISHHFELYFRATRRPQPLPDLVLDHGRAGRPTISASRARTSWSATCSIRRTRRSRPGLAGGRASASSSKGKLMYDPRKDDTVPGGSGDQRWEDPDTWVWSDNAAVCRYNWVRGVYADDDVTDQTKLLIGGA